jgi:hypothetical protein
VPLAGTHYRKRAQTRSYRAICKRVKVVGEDERGRRTEREEGGRRREFEPNLGASPEAEAILHGVTMLTDVGWASLHSSVWSAAGATTADSGQFRPAGTGQAIATPSSAGEFSPMCHGHF